MSNTKCNGQQKAKAETRLDTAHTAQSVPDAPSAGAPSAGDLPAGDLPEASSNLPRLLLVEKNADEVMVTGEPAPAERLQKQAGELAERLQQRQSDLDHRESELNIRSAAVESQRRSSEIWVLQRQEKISAQLEEIARDRELLDLQQTDGDEIQRPTQPPVEPAENTGSMLDSESIDESELEDRHRKLDQRQAQLYQDIEDLTAKRAQLEAQREEAEALRDELEAAHEVLAEQRNQLDQKSSELGAKSSEIKTLTVGLDHRMAEYEDRCHEMNHREQQLGARTKEVELALMRFKRLGVTEQRIRAVEQETTETETRSQYLDDAEALFSEQQIEFEQARRQLNQDRQKSEQLRHRERQEFEAVRNQSNREAERNSQALDRRRKELDTRETALSQLQAELSATQREVLEMRLAAEEVWAQLSGALAPASLTRSITQVRARLLEHHRLAGIELNERIEELHTLSKSLAEKREQLVDQKTELENWAAHRHEDIEKQAARLIAREQELDRQQVYYEELQTRWNVERAEYRHEIQQLLAALRHPEKAAA